MNPSFAVPRGPLHHRTRIVLCSFLLISSVARAQEADGGTPALSPEEAKALEKEFAKEAQEQKPSTAPAPAPSTVARAIQSLNPDISFIADVAAAAFSSRDPLQTGDHDPTKRGFNLQQLEMAVGAAVDPYFRFDANIVFHPDEVEIEEVYATTLALPAGLQLRAGQFLTRFGRLNNTHPHVWDFADQPFSVGRVFGGEGNRGLGVEASWLTPLPWYAELVGSVTDATTGRSFLADTGVGTEGVGDFQFTGALKQFHDLTDNLSLLWGLSFADGPNGSGSSNRTDILGADLYLKYRPVTGADPTVLSLQAEWFYRRRELTSATLRDNSGYAQVFWRFAQRWGVAARHEIGFAADGLNAAVPVDPLDPEWTDTRQRTSLSVTFWPTEFSRIRLQPAVDFVGWRPKPDYALFLAFEFSVGPHGAHAF